LRGEVVKIDFEIQCSAQVITDSGKVYNTGFYMYPRSSLSKTRLRLANAVGIIDSGYRGNLIGAFDIIDDCSVTKNTRLTQICAPSLMPIFVTVVDNLSDLGEQTERGTGGFGSTGL
jgi:dUTP pyrophosphatase